MESKLLTSNIALKILLFNDIKEKEDFFSSKNKWIMHSIYVGIAAGRIAYRLGLDVDYLTSLGLIHDIGRKISHINHPILGYKLLKEIGFKDEANISLTHSFIENNINLTCGIGPSLDVIDFFNSKLGEATIYDNIIQLCDLFCLETGFTTIEKRLLDIYSRKEITEKSLVHYKETIKLKEKIESMLGIPLYDLFKEIEDLDKEEYYKEELSNLFKTKGKKFNFKLILV